MVWLIRGNFRKAILTKWVKAIRGLYQLPLKWHGLQSVINALSGKGWNAMANYTNGLRLQKDGDTGGLLERKLLCQKTCLALLVPSVVNYEKEDTKFQNSNGAALLDISNHLKQECVKVFQSVNIYLICGLLRVRKKRELESLWYIGNGGKLYLKGITILAKSVVIEVATAMKSNLKPIILNHIPNILNYGSEYPMVKHYA